MLVSEDVLAIIDFFSRGMIDTRTLREYLAEKFFSTEPGEPLDHMVLGELEVALAEYERGDRAEGHVRDVASTLLEEATSLRTAVSHLVGQEPRPVLV